MHFRVCPTSVIAQQTPHASSALPQDMSAKQTKSVITVDLWFNRLWQHWKVVNEIAFFICISVFADKSNQEHACCTASLVWSWLNQTGPAVILSSWRETTFQTLFGHTAGPWGNPVSGLHIVCSHDSQKKLGGERVAILCLCQLLRWVCCHITCQDWYKE